MIDGQRPPLHGIQVRLSELEETCYAKSSSLVLGSARILRAFFDIVPKSFSVRQDAEHFTLEAFATIRAVGGADDLLCPGTDADSFPG